MDVVAQNVHWLLPEENVPCDVFLHFRGQFALGVAGGQPASISFLEKLAKADYRFVYVRRGDLPTWEEWRAARHPRPGESVKPKESETDRLYGNKRAEFLTYLQKILHKRVEDNRSLNFSFDNALAITKKVISHPMLDWYFQQFHEPPDLFYHGARVAFPLAIFGLENSLGVEKDIESIVFSVVIHELSGEPKESLKTVVSEQTLTQLESEQQPVPEEVIELIRMHDELFSGKGFPKNLQGNAIPELVRAFSLFNHFDHYRLAATGTRRARFDRAKQKMTARKADYDPNLWPKFWAFWENSVEAIS